jgi:hypothetical protein
MLNAHGLPVRGSLVIWLGDGMSAGEAFRSRRVPTVAYTRTINDAYTLLMPDPAFLGSAGYAEDRPKIKKATQETPWEERRPVVYWRGTCLLAKDLGREDLVDVKISQFPHDADLRVLEELRANNIVAPPLPFVEFLRNRYQVDIDGVSCAWISFFWKLYSGCPVLKIQSENLQWYYPDLLPWRDFVPVSEDLSNLREVVEWVQAHDAECRRIGESAAGFMEGLTYERALRETWEMVQQLLECQRN